MPETHRETVVSGMKVVETTHEGGHLSYRLDPLDFTRVDITLKDNVGRTQALTVYQSTVLVVVPIGNFGAFPFDPVPNKRDDDNKPVWLQRVVLDRGEVSLLAANQVRAAREEAFSKIGRPGPMRIPSDILRGKS